MGNKIRFFFKLHISFCHQKCHGKCQKNMVLRNSSEKNFLRNSSEIYFEGNFWVKHFFRNSSEIQKKLICYKILYLVENASEGFSYTQIFLCKYRKRRFRRKFQGNRTLEKLPFFKSVLAVSRQSHYQVSKWSWKILYVTM